MSKMVSFRFPEELLERVDSARGEEPRSKFVIRALEGALSVRVAPTNEATMKTYVPARSIPCEEVKQMGRKYDEETALVDEVERTTHYPVLRCPSSGCDFQAPSPNARCPKHGRRVR